MIERAGLIAVTLVFAGCSYGAQLTPSPAAKAVQGTEHAAQATTAGVSVHVTAQAWSEEPLDLEAFVTPLRVRVENHRETSIRMSYPQFGLVSDTGFRYGVMPPFDISRPPTVGGAAPGAGRVWLGARSIGPGSVSGAPGNWYRFHHDRFRVAPHLHPWYSSIDAWHDPFYDPIWGPYGYDWYVSWRPALPTEDMIAEALPEGVVEPGGSVEGFLYFQRLREDATEATFTLRLVDAESGESLGEVAIPFVVEN